MMTRSILPEVFDEILDSPLNSAVEKAIESGRTAIGYTCSYIPEALLSVDGLLPVRLRAPRASSTPMADTYLSSVVCPYPRSLLELVFEGQLDFLGGWVFAASCDHLRRLYDNLAYLFDPKFNHIVDVPHKRSPAALTWFVDELGGLAEALAANFAVKTDTEALRAAIERLNGQLEILSEIGSLRRKAQPPISGTDFHKILVASVTAPREVLSQPLRELRDHLTTADGIDDHRARLMVVGSQIDEPAYLQIIESMGGLVVADRFCLGSLPGLEPVEINRDPLRAMAQAALMRTRCPRMMEDFELRFKEVLQAVEEYDVDGVVVETMKFCDIWGVESSALVSALREARIPVLRLEREYALTAEGQLRTRIQAFLESMGK